MAKKRYEVVDFITVKVDGIMGFRFVKQETRIEAKNLPEAKELLSMADSKEAYIFDNASKKKITFPLLIVCLA